MSYRQSDLRGRVGLETKWCRDGWEWIQMLVVLGGDDDDDDDDDDE